MCSSQPFGCVDVITKKFLRDRAHLTKCGEHRLNAQAVLLGGCKQVTKECIRTNRTLMILFDSSQRKRPARVFAARTPRLRAIGDFEAAVLAQIVIAPRYLATPASGLHLSTNSMCKSARLQVLRAKRNLKLLVCR